MIGTSLKHYRIVEKVGEGGMGVVYRAVDTHLDRTVAIKMLRPEAVGDAERKWRFVREAKAASALNHPHIVTIHDIDSDAGVDFMVMEYLEGSSLDRLIPKTGLPLPQALDYGEQIASALGAAHTAGIVHRDVKPANVMVGKTGRVKVLDFGLAKLVEPDAPAGSATTDSTATATAALARTQQGAILGTIAYMSPEQAMGKPVDARSDVFSLGSVFYEMIAGGRPFQGDSHLLTLTAILRDAPAPLNFARPDLPAEFEAIVRRSLEKKPEARYANAAEMEKDLAALRGRGAATDLKHPLKRSHVMPAAIVLLLLFAGAAGWWFWGSSREREAREVTLPEIARLNENERPGRAMALALEGERRVPEEVARLKQRWLPLRLRTEPPGAEISIKDYLDIDGPWLPLGVSALETRIPLGFFRWRIAKPGFATRDLAAQNFTAPVRLDPTSAVPAGMVRVAGGEFALRSLQPLNVEPFWIDTHEVTNRQFKDFVDAGGYGKREYWKAPFRRGGRELSWEGAQALMLDATGRPGPSTWELGSYPEGREDYPVQGVSWYEAAAYAEFAGKSLPTIYHWYTAAGSDNFSQILRLSNYGGKGPARVGSHQGISPDGAYDMAGNVKEWCWNESDDRRYLAGGSWAEPTYTFLESDAQDPFDRLPRNGFRCVKYERPLADPALAAAVPATSRDYNEETPVPDDVFEVYRSFYAYDESPLDARGEGPAVEEPYWRRQKVSYAAAYGRERIPAFLFLPKNARPPYQTVVYFPSNAARMVRSSDEMDLQHVEFVIRSGRAVLFPIYQDTHERLLERRPTLPNLRRDLIIQWSKDLGRSLDYLETRKDVDLTRLAYYGVSLGAIDGVVLLGLENRFRTAVLTAGGFRFAHYPPEVEPVNFAPRVKIPVLLVSGRYDFGHPYETTQAPLFRLLGSPEKDKRHVVFEGGHVPTQMQPIIKETLDWLDRYLGKVGTAPGG